MGSLSAQYSHSQGNWRLILMVMPEERGRLEGPLLETSLAALPGRSVVVLDYIPGVADERLIDLGFRPVDTFVWMGFNLDVELRERPSGSGDDSGGNQNG